MKFHKSILVVLFALSIATSIPALSQSQKASQTGRHSLLEQLGLGVHRAPAAGAAVRFAPDPVALGLATARVYRFASADFPGASLSIVFDENNSTVVGDSSFNGFTLRFGIYQGFTAPGSSGAIATGINTTGEIVGIYADLSNKDHGFLDNAGTFTTLDIGAGGTTEPLGINDSGEIVGVFIDAGNVSHGFFTLDNGGSYTTFDPPGSKSTLPFGVNSAGTISGSWTDASSKTHGFLYSGGVFSSFDFPLATSTNGFGINDSNEVAGGYTDAANVTHGFIYSAGNFTKVDVTGATSTTLSRIKNKGQITGVYTDSSNEQHGLTGR